MNRPGIGSQRHVRRSVLLLSTCLLIVVAVVYALPIYATITTAFRSSKELLTGNLWSLPKEVYLGALKRAWVEQRLARHALNTVVVAMPALFVAMCLSCLAAYPIAHMRFRGRQAVFLLFVSGMFFPPQIFIIPVYELARKLGIYDTRLGLILVHSIYSLPFSILMLTTSLQLIPSEVLDAGRIDGASELRVLLSLILPLARNALAVIGIFLFTWIWNDFLWGLVMTQSPSVQPIMIGVVNSAGRLAFNWNGQSAAALIATTPPAVAFILMQRLFTKGVMLGSVKQ